ncbi:MAG: hypothetical protein ACFFFC_08365 [Candidatus Thorarchaeota archaeon]
MVRNKRIRTRIVSILLSISIMVPATWEAQIWGVGEHIVTDAGFSQIIFAGAFYAIEWNSSNAMGHVLNTFELMIPQVNPVALLVWTIGILSLLVSVLVLNNRLGSGKGFLMIFLSAALLMLAPPINTSIVEEVYTYRMRPLLVPQIVNSLVLIWYARTRSLE